jgi:flagellar hook-associated protein 3 FlgL
MRVTDSILKNNFLTNLSFASERLYEKETRVLTNKRVNKPSDDPVDALNSLTIRVRLNDIEQYRRNISRTKTFLQNTETIVQQVADMFSRVKELAVQGASDSYGPNDKLSVSYEIDQLIEQLLISSNNRSETTYTFAGTYNNVPPYVAVRDENGTITQVTSSGSSGDIVRVLGESVRIKANVNGEELFERGVNLFDALISLRDNLKSADTDAVRQDIIILDEAAEKVYNIQAVIGSKINRVNAADSRAENDEINFSEFLSNAEDIDAAQAIIDYQMELLTLQTSLQAGARLLRPRLGDFLQ